jgi:hypothetical protein
MAKQPSLSLGVSVTTADAARWRAESRRKREEARKLIESADADDKLADVAEKLFDLLEGSSSRPAEFEPLPPAPIKQNVVALQPTRRPEPFSLVSFDATESFVSAVRKLVFSADLGIAPHEAKSVLAKTPLSERLGQSDKGFYHAIDRLAARNEIIRHNGRMFSPVAYERFKKAVAAGEIKDEAPRIASHSPMGEAIMAIVRANPGISGGSIIIKLREDPEFDAALTPHNSGAYNVIARLVLRRQLRKTGDKRYFIGKESQ